MPRLRDPQATSVGRSSATASIAERPDRDADVGRGRVPSSGLDVVGHRVREWPAGRGIRVRSTSSANLQHHRRVLDVAGVQKHGGPARARQARRQCDAQAHASEIDARATGHADDQQILVPDREARPDVSAGALGRIARSSGRKSKRAGSTWTTVRRASTSDVLSDLGREDDHASSDRNIPTGTPPDVNVQTNARRSCGGDEGGVADTGVIFEPVDGVVLASTYADHAGSAETTAGQAGAYRPAIGTTGKPAARIRDAVTADGRRFQRRSMR